MKIRPETPEFVVAGEALAGDYFWTAQSPAKPKVLVQVIGTKHDYGELGVVLRAWVPDYEEWHDVVADPKYKLQKIKEGTVKIPKVSVVKTSVPGAPAKKVSAAPAAKAAPRAKVPAVWGEAFKLYGTAKDAPAKIVAHMKKAFPQKDTAWEKWVELVRGRFNRGELGVAAPAKPLPPYNGKRDK